MVDFLCGLTEQAHWFVVKFDVCCSWRVGGKEVSLHTREVSSHTREVSSHSREVGSNVGKVSSHAKEVSSNSGRERHAAGRSVSVTPRNFQLRGVERVMRGGNTE